jgi:hypothetical protein
MDTGVRKWLFESLEPQSPEELDLMTRIVNTYRSIVWIRTSDPELCKAVFHSARAIGVAIQPHHDMETRLTLLQCMDGIILRLWRISNAQKRKSE